MQRLLTATILLVVAIPFAAADEPATSSVAPRRPKIPVVDGIEHPIDRFLAAYLARHEAGASAAVDDRAFARRVYLDCVGLLPTPDELDAFVADRSADKRSRLVDRLLADNDRYAEHWMSFWNDCLRNDYRGTGYIDGGRQQITAWLREALATNMPFDRFVRELIDSTPSSEGFVKGIVWRGVVNASQVPEVQAAQNISQVFLGLNLKCASCHDSFINEWQLSDAYGLAGVFAEDRLEMHRCDRPTAEFAPVKFLYPELGSIDASAPRAERMNQLAQIVTSPENGRLTRTIVNRLWAKLLGRGFIEPPDEMDNPSWNADLLDWLASDLTDNGYNLKRTLRLILTSQAYQMPAVDPAGMEADDFVFRGPVVRRMSAEQYVDAVSALTGQWQLSSATFAGAAPPPDDGQSSAEPHRNQVRFASGVVTQGPIAVEVDLAGASSLWLVVKQAGGNGDFDWADWADPRLIGPQGETRLTDLSWSSATTGYGEIQLHKNIVGNTLALGGTTYDNGIGTHADSVIVYQLPQGVERFVATAGPDDEAVSKSSTGHDMEFIVMTDVEARAVSVPADPLMTALGRPNREQVVTNRATAATTLQALELTNGATLADVLAKGARHWLAMPPVEGQDLIDRIYLEAVGRPPLGAERQTAETLAGSPPTAEGLEDLLWALTMLPEFQLIY